MFKARLPFAPYFYVQVRASMHSTQHAQHSCSSNLQVLRPAMALLPQVVEGCEGELEGYLRRKFEGLVREVEVVAQEDLDLVSGG
jgi:hypothetical protein